MRRTPDLTDLPPALNVKRAAALLCVSSDSLYDAIRAGQSPVPVLRVGRTIRIPTAAVLAALGVDGPATEEPTP